MRLPSMRLPSKCLVLAFSALASPAFGDDYIEFRSPTGNIQCGLYVGSDGSGVRCDLSQMSAQTYSYRPPGCEYDWGSSFAVEGYGKGYLACVSDVVGMGDGPVLGYGRSISLGGITCISETSGMTCVNEGGHGFTVAKARQRLF